MAEAQTVSAKYIFLDVEGYSSNRSVEAQTYIIEKLNALVSETLQEQGSGDESRVLLPTGDGLCIALLDPNSPFDSHLLIALGILGRLETHNQATQDEMRKFRVRIGLNANVDNLVTDINGKKNIAGAGINIAQRVMSLADGNQILVSENVYETLRHREKYMRSFKQHAAIAKHGLNLRVHQFIEQKPGLDTSLPIQFKRPEVPAQKEEPLPEKVAYYFAHAIRNKEFLKPISRRQFGSLEADAAIVLLWFLAEDSVERAAAGEFNSPHPITHKPDASFAVQLQFYRQIDIWVIDKLGDLIESKYLSDHSLYFDESNFSMERHFINQKGKAKLKADWPKIWAEFELKD